MHAAESCACTVICLRLATQLPLKVPDRYRCLPGSSPITRSSPSSSALQKSGSFPPPELPGFIGTTSLSDSRSGRRLEATLRPLPSPQRVSPVARITFPACRAHYPGGPDRCSRRLLPHPCGLPRYAGGSASASSLSRPAQASLILRPAGSLDRPRRPLSRGFRSASYPTDLLVSYQTIDNYPGGFLLHW